MVVDDIFDVDDDVKLLFDDVILSLLFVDFFNDEELLVDFLMIGFITGPMVTMLYFNQLVLVGDNNDADED